MDLNVLSLFFALRSARPICPIKLVVYVYVRARLTLEAHAGENGNARAHPLRRESSDTDFKYEQSNTHPVCPFVSLRTSLSL